MQPFITFLKRIDIFGRPIQFTFNERYKFKSIPGAICSLILGIILLTIGSSNMRRMFLSEIENINSDYRSLSLDDTNAFSPGEAGFAMAVGFTKQKENRRIATWKVNLVENKFDGKSYDTRS